MYAHLPPFPLIYDETKWKILSLFSVFVLGEGGKEPRPLLDKHRFTNNAVPSASPPPHTYRLESFPNRCQIISSLFYLADAWSMLFENEEKEREMRTDEIRLPSARWKSTSPLLSSRSTETERKIISQTYYALLRERTEPSRSRRGGGGGSSDEGKGYEHATLDGHATRPSKLLDSFSYPRNL